jgi:HlyD family secretion protein
MNNIRKHRSVSGGRTRILCACLLFTVLAGFGCGSGREVEVLTPKRGEIRESFTEPARTRLEKTYRIVMPVDGRIARINLEPGDEVTAGMELVEFDLVPFRQEVEEASSAVEELNAQITVKDDHRLENTALIETRATVKAATEALKAADAQVAAEETRANRAAREVARMEAAETAVTEDALDEARTRAETAIIELRKQEFYAAALRALVVAVNLGPRFVNEYIDRKELEREVLVEQLIQARARLARAEHQLSLARLESPIDGVVLERFEQGDSPLPAGQPLLILGDMGKLEVIAEVLTQDALRLAPGSEVSLEPAARIEPIPGKVKRIEPAGFTKLSSLGVEQQRVNVIVSFAGDHDHLGVGYRLQARFFTGSKENALIVPRFSVLQEPGGLFYVLKVRDGRLAKQPVEIGLRSDLELEVTDGLSENDGIVSRPDSSLREGAEVKVRGVQE